MPPASARLAGYHRGMARATSVRVVTLGFLVVSLVACFDQPVEEHLGLCFLADGEVVLTVSGEIRPTAGSRPNQALDQRLAEARADFAGGLRSWDACFDAMAPALERLEVERIQGDATRVHRRAVALDPEELRAFFRLTDVDVSWTVSDGRAALEISPRSSSRATQADRRRVASALEEWSQELGTYLGQVAALYGYLDTRPARAEACLAKLFGTPETAELTPEEATLVDRLSDIMNEVTRVLEVPRNEAHTLEELSRRVYDPFPARLWVTLPVPPEEVEGFVLDGNGRLVVPGLSLWEAFVGLAGRWAAPDPLCALVDHVRRHQTRRDFPLATFLAEPRRWQTPPAPGELRAALEAGLRPAPMYRAAWRQSIPDSDELPTFSWATVPCPLQP